jgi:hypothetical protein
MESFSALLIVLLKFLMNSGGEKSTKKVVERMKKTVES